MRKPILSGPSVRTSIKRSPPDCGPKQLYPAALPDPTGQQSWTARPVNCPDSWLQRPNRAQRHLRLPYPRLGGPSACLQGRPSPPTSGLRHTQRERLRELLYESPRTFGYTSSAWSLPLAAKVAFAQGITSRKVSGEAIRLELTASMSRFLLERHHSLLQVQPPLRSLCIVKLEDGVNGFNLDAVTAMVERICFSCSLPHHDSAPSSSVLGQNRFQTGILQGSVDTSFWRAPIVVSFSQ